MWQTVRWTLRQRRYSRLAALSLVLALGCIAAGTWQIERFSQSVRDNRALDHNAHAAATALTGALAPLTGTGPAPGRDQVRFRTVTATGTYLAATSYLPGKIVNRVGGFDAVTPLRTAGGIVIIDRGFVAATSGDRPGPIPPPPAGQVTVTGRLDTPSSAQAATDPARVAARLSTPVYQSVLILAAKRPGSAGLVSPGNPDLSNPAGGAYEAQHFAYIIQWYAFAIIALVAPFAIARNEVREAQRRFLGIDAGEAQFDAPLLDTARVAAIERAPGAEIVTRAAGALVTAGGDPRELARAKRLADRYGRALSMGEEVDAPATAAPVRPRTPVGSLTDRVPDSASVPHRSHDAYQGSYNDYLWQLGLADGDVGHGAPDPEGRRSVAESGRPGADGPVAIEASVLDVDPVDVGPAEGD